MRIRISTANQKSVHAARKKGDLSAHAEVNRALAEHYEKPPAVIDTKALQDFLGSHNARRFLRHE